MLTKGMLTKGKDVDERNVDERKRSGKEVRECETEKKRASVLRLCFNVEFICWLRAMKRRLLASLLATADKCWTMGRVQE